MDVIRNICKQSLENIAERPAIISSKENISYLQLENKVHNAAKSLYSQGIRQHSKAAILSRNNCDYIICVLALWELNACVIPLNIRLTDIELSEIINFSEAEFLLIQKNENRNLSIQVPKIILPLGSSNSETDIHASEINSNDISLIIFTSGVTGKPKGVVHSLKNLLNSADNSQAFLSQSTDDKWLASLPFYHIGGLSIITRAIRFGSAIIIPDSLKNDDLKKAFDKFKPSFASLVSTQLQRLLKTDWEPGEELKNLLLGGGSADEELIRKAISVGCKISNVYGSTETSAFISANSGINIKQKPLSAGKPLGKNKISIVDNELNPLPAGSSETILIESNALFNGYFKDEEATKKKLKDGKFLTGDIGFIDGGGDLFIEARRTDLIITGGENVNPVEVENILNKLPQVKECCVFGLDDKEWGQIVAAAVVLNSPISILELAGFMKDKIAAYKIPKRFFPVEEIPKSSLGKIMREKVREEINILIK